jgi:hypothetical protein
MRRQVVVYKNPEPDAIEPQRAHACILSSARSAINWKHMIPTLEWLPEGVNFYQT